MGMAASQARLLSITARLSNNENTGQSISYAKQRLADQTQQITNEYNEALDATKLVVLTGFNGAEANYTDISYSLLTGTQMASDVKQYIVTDTKGRILVTNDIAEAYEGSSGNYNQFLANLGYSQADITVQISDQKWNNADGSAANPGASGAVKDEDTLAAEQKIHEAWDKYFATVGINLGDDEHDFGFGWVETVRQGGDIKNPNDYAIGQGYATYTSYMKNENGEYVGKDGQTPLAKDEYSDETLANADYSWKYFDENGAIVEYDYDTDGDGINDAYTEDIDEKGYTSKFVDENNNEVAYDAYSEDNLKNNGLTIKQPINYEGTTEESRDLYDYAMALTEAYLRVNTDSNKDTPFHVEYNMEDVESAADPENVSILTYYRNIFDKMQSDGYFTYTDVPAEADENHIYASVGTGTAGNVQKSPLEDNVTFEAALRDGTLRLEYYSTTDKAFKSTTISEDTCIQEVEDERAIAKAESKYNQDMIALENQDKKLDLELKKLDTEHSALQTEYDSVKNIIDKNVESSFKTFG